MIAEGIGVGGKKRRQQKAMGLLKEGINVYIEYNYNLQMLILYAYKTAYVYYSTVQCT